MHVSGREGRPQPPPIERIHRAYREPCMEFADDLGWDRNVIAGWFEQFQLIRMSEQGWPRNLAAWMAMRDVHAFFWKIGAEDAN
jgi:hypothetical protein